MVFAYTEVDVPPTPAFPHQTVVLRPYLTVRIARADKHLRMKALVDSGADHCLFPSSVATELGIAVPNPRWSEFDGTSGLKQIAYFERVELAVVDVVNRQNTLAFEADIGFCDDLEADGIGYLGQNGFLSEVHVRFNLRFRSFEIDWESSR